MSLLSRYTPYFLTSKAHLSNFVRQDSNMPLKVFGGQNRDFVLILRDTFDTDHYWFDRIGNTAKRAPNLVEFVGAQQSIPPPKYFSFLILLKIGANF